MAKPSEEIGKKLLDWVETHPDTKQSLRQAPDDIVYTTIASATMIQMILNWLDEKFPDNV